VPGLPALAQLQWIVIASRHDDRAAAALGIPERNALEFVPKEIGACPLK